jgi:hypothetical protein
MGCCGRNKILPKRSRSTPAPAAVSLSAKSATITGINNRRYSLTGPLIRPPGRPEGGWRAALPVGGQTVKIRGRTALEAYNAAKVLLSRNGVSVPAPELWLSLNLQWLAKTPPQFHLVPLAGLMKVTESVPEAVKDNRRRSYKPADWGAIAWGWLNLFLAREEYHFRDFLLQCNYVLDMLSPATNPEIGCQECWNYWGLALEDLKKNPGLDKAGARKWLVARHNEVNAKLKKPVLSYEVAAKKAFWI